LFEEVELLDLTKNLRVLIRISYANLEAFITEAQPKIYVVSLSMSSKCSAFNVEMFVVARCTSSLSRQLLPLFTV